MSENFNADDSCHTGIEHFQAGSIPEAISCFSLALQQDQQHLQSYIYLGLCMKQVGENEKAELCYRAALDLNPDLPEVRYNLGNILQAKGDLPAAGACYEAAVALQPGFALAYYNLGNVRRDQGQLDDAIGHYRVAIEREPNLAAGHNNLGNALAQQDQLEEAIEHYQAALAIEPNFSDALYNLGNALHFFGDFESAPKYFKASGIKDWAARSLYCAYKSENEESTGELLRTCLETEHISPQVAAISSHYHCRHGDEDPYQFCLDALNTMTHRPLPEIAAGTPLNFELQSLLSNIEMSERHQGRLHNGMQSSGNLLLRDEPALVQLASLIHLEFDHFKKRHADKDCTGYREELFSSTILPIQTGDIVLFPSSLFHRTIPFTADEDRICIAFDLKPALERR